MISVIVSTYNRAERLGLVLTALSKQVGGFEVIVSDDGTEDQGQTFAVVDRSWPMPVSYTWHPHKGFGLARTRNDGARIAKGALFHFIDSDILVAPGSLTVDWELFMENQKSPIGGLFDYLPPMTISPEEVERWDLIKPGKVNRDGNPIIADVRDSWRQMGRLGEDPFLYEHKPLWSPLVLIGGNMVIPRYCFEKVGGFDEGFTMYGGEDADMSLNLISHGFGIRYSRRIYGLHMHHPPNTNATVDSEQTHLKYLAKKYPAYWNAPGVPNPDVWGKEVQES